MLLCMLKNYSLPISLAVWESSALEAFADLNTETFLIHYEKSEIQQIYNLSE